MAYEEGAEGQEESFSSLETSCEEIRKRRARKDKPYLRLVRATPQKATERPREREKWKERES